MSEAQIIDRTVNKDTHILMTTLTSTEERVIDSDELVRRFASILEESGFVDDDRRPQWSAAAIEFLSKAVIDTQTHAPVALSATTSNKRSNMDVKVIEAATNMDGDTMLLIQAGGKELVVNSDGLARAFAKLVVEANFSVPAAERAAWLDAAARQLQQEVVAGDIVEIEGGVGLASVYACRPAVQRFALAMEKRLRELDEQKGPEGWLGMSRQDLLTPAREALAVAALAFTGDTPGLQSVLMHEAVDAANYLMMFYDNESMTSSKTSTTSGS